MLRSGGSSEKSKQAGTLGQWYEGGDVWDCCVQGSGVEVHPYESQCQINIRGDTLSSFLSLELWFTWKQPGDLCDHRTVWAWRDLKDHLIPTPLPWMILLALLFTASAGRWIFNDPNYHPQELHWPKSQMWPWQLQSLHCAIDLVLAATLNSSIKNSKDLPSTLFIVIEDLHYSHVWTLKHNLSFIITFIPFFFKANNISVKASS